MKHKTLAALLGATVLGIGVVVGSLKYRLDVQTARAETAALRADSAEASRDSTRRALLGEVSVYMRRAIQAELSRDSVSDLLGEEERARARLEVQVDSLTARTTAPVLGDPDDPLTRLAEFEIDEGPYTGTASVSVPPAPGEATLSIAATLEPIALGVRIGCREDADAIRSATVGIEAPSWATVRIDSIQQDPEVCNPDLTIIDDGGLFSDTKAFLAGAVSALAALGLIWGIS